MQNAQTQGGFFTGLGNFFLDALDTAKDVVIEREFSEGGGERAEGLTEFGNPGTVSQPVVPSQLPSGQPFLSNISQQFGVPPTILMIGAGALGAVLFLRLAK